MNVQLLIDAIVRQTTVLIAQLATAGGVRAPLSHIAGNVFVTLAREIEQQGISRKVSADMFGMALRTYQRKTQRLRESETERGRSLWEAVFDYVNRREVATRREVLERFHRDDEALVRGVLRDLNESGLVFASGSGGRTAYRVASEGELSRLRRVGDEADIDAFVWALVYREGPLSRAALAQRCALRPEVLDASLARLLAGTRIRERQGEAEPLYSSSELVIGLEQAAGWESAVLDQFQAMVRTICLKLGLEPGARASDAIGGSTYAFIVWPEHPLHGEVLSQLRRFRAAASELRQRVDAHNRTSGIPERYMRVITYGGQCVIEESDKDTEDTHEDDCSGLQNP